MRDAEKILTFGILPCLNEDGHGLKLALFAHFGLCLDDNCPKEKED